MKPGEHLVVIGGEVNALKARQAGLQLRDALLILNPGPLVTVAYLFRAPLDGTAAITVFEHEAGGICIDGCRVFGETITTHSRGRNQAFPKRPGESTPQQSGRIKNQGDIEINPRNGRWPSNLLLVHGPECIQTGQKQIHATPSRWKHYPELPKISSQVYAQDTWTKDNMVTSGVSHDDNGTETVPAYTCQPDCPVRLLDEQTAHLHGAWNVKAEVNHEHGNKVYSGGWRPERQNPDYYGNDGGGASRFYPQFASLPEACDWLCRLADFGVLSGP